MWQMPCPAAMGTHPHPPPPPIRGSVLHYEEIMNFFKIFEKEYSDLRNIFIVLNCSSEAIILHLRTSRSGSDLCFLRLHS